MKKAISSPGYQKLICWLAQSRKSRGYSMRQLATLLDEPHSVIQNVENCERRLDIYEYVEYCGALEIDPVDGIHLLVAETSNLSE